MISTRASSSTAGDLSDTRASAGTPVLSHRKVRKLRPPSPRSAARATCSGATSRRRAASPRSRRRRDGSRQRDPRSDPLRSGMAEDGRERCHLADGRRGSRAVLVAYDANVTPLQGSCGDPLNGGLATGTNLDRHGRRRPRGRGTRRTAPARSFFVGTTNNPTYGTNAQRVTASCSTRRATPTPWFFRIGRKRRPRCRPRRNPDPGSVSDPATAKNAIIVGGSGNAREPFQRPERAGRYADPASARPRRVRRASHRS